jgi:hypothetical protein
LKKEICGVTDVIVVRGGVVGVVEEMSALELLRTTVVCVNLAVVGLVDRLDVEEVEGGELTAVIAFGVVDL